MRVLDWILRLAGLGALIPGLLYWIAQLNVITFHMLFGLLVALSLLIISLLAVFTRGLRILGAIGIVYAFILPIFGLNQARLLIGDMHWLIQTLHMLVGIAALAFAGLLSTSYTRIRAARIRSAQAS